MLILVLFFPLKSRADSWQTVIIPNVLTFRIPPYMELPTDIFKNISDSITKNIKLGGDNSGIIFLQTKGTNDWDIKAIQKVYSINILNEKTKKHSLPSITSKLPYSQKQIDAWYEHLKNTYTPSNNYEIIEWFPAKIVTINGRQAIYSSHKERYENKKVDLFQQYIFFNDDISHAITLIFPSQDIPKLKKSLAQFIESFEFVDRSKL